MYLNPPAALPPSSPSNMRLPLSPERLRPPLCPLPHLNEIPPSSFICSKGGGASVKHASMDPVVPSASLHTLTVTFIVAPPDPASPPARCDDDEPPSLLRLLFEPSSPPPPSLFLLFFFPSSSLSLFPIAPLTPDKRCTCPYGLGQLGNRGPVNNNYYFLRNQVILKFTSPGFLSWRVRSHDVIFEFGSQER